MNPKAMPIMLRRFVAAVVSAIGIVMALALWKETQSIALAVTFLTPFALAGIVLALGE